MRHRKSDLPAIADDNAPVPPAHWPTRWTVRRVRTIALVLVGLAFVASLLSVYLTYEAAQLSAAQAGAVNERLSVLEDDLAERTRQRDAERDAAAARAAQDREQFRARFCEVLAELSATFPNLDQLRQVLGCAQIDAAANAPAGDTGPPPAAQGSPQPTVPAPSPPAAPAPPSPPAPVPPSDAPADPGLVCGLLPILC